MPAKWKKRKGLNPQVLLDKYKDIYTITSDKRISYSGFDKLELDVVLFTMIDFGGPFSHHTSSQILNEAIGACCIESNLSESNFIKHINNLISKFNSQREIIYILTTSLSIANGLPYKKIDLDHAKIISYPKGLPKKYNSRSHYDSKWKGNESALPSSYCPVTVTVKSKHWAEAFDKALDALDYSRGIFSLFTNPDSEFSLMGGKNNKPLNKIMLGGMHCLHLNNGKLANSEIFWYERNFEEKKVIQLDQKKSKIIRKNFEFIKKKLDKHKDKYTIRDAIIRYVRAFDEQDHNVTVQKLWAALETLAATGEQNAEAIVRRCSYLFAEREYHQQILEHVREYRNRNVHAGYSIQSLNWHCYQLQRYFRELIFFYARNVEDFPSLGEANHFLDLSDSPAKLRQEIKIRERALSFLSTDP